MKRTILALSIGLLGCGPSSEELKAELSDNLDPGCELSLVSTDGDVFVYEIDCEP